MKDTEHIDPISGHIVGLYHKGKIDAPRQISFFREPDSHVSGGEEDDDGDSEESHRRRTRSNGRRRPYRQHSRRSSRENSVRFQDDNVTVPIEPIKLHVTFRDRPVLLPDGVSQLPALSDTDDYPFCILIL